MSTQTADPVEYYVKLPGSAIAHRKDGTGIHLLYGQKVPLEELSDASLANLHRFADTTFRGVDSDPNLEAAAHARTALANAGQVNSGSSPVPGNYAELDEDTAARLVANMELYPQSQAQVLIHEKLFHGGRQKVIDAASYAAQVSCDLQIEAAGALQRQIEAAGGFLPPTPSPVGDVGTGISDGANARIVHLQNIEATAAVPQPFGSGDGDTPPTPVDNSAVEAAQRAAEEQRAALVAAQDTAAAQAAEIEALKAQLAEAGQYGDDQKVAADEAPADYSAFSYDDLKSYIDQHSLGIAKNQSAEALIAAISAVEGHEKPKTPPASASQS